MPRIYRTSEMGGTPGGFTNQPGTVVAALDAVLVEAGWTIAHTATNRRAYKQGAAPYRYLYVDDSMTAAACRWRMYDAMSDIDTGTNPVPNESQLSGGSYLYKSANTAPRPWAMLASATDWIVYVEHQETTLGAVGSTAVREMLGMWETDEGAIDGTVVACNPSASPGFSAFALSNQPNIGNANWGGVHTTSRKYRSAGGQSQFVIAFTDPAAARDNQRIGAGANMQARTNVLRLAPIYVCDPADRITLGTIPMVWAACHTPPDPFETVEDANGNLYQGMQSCSQGSWGRVIWEIPNE